MAEWVGSLLGPHIAICPVSRTKMGLVDIRSVIKKVRPNRRLRPSAHYRTPIPDGCISGQTTEWKFAAGPRRITVPARSRQNGCSSQTTEVVSLFIRLAQGRRSSRRREPGHGPTLQLEGPYQLAGLSFILCPGDDLDPVEPDPPPAGAGPGGGALLGVEVAPAP